MSSESLSEDPTRAAMKDVGLVVVIALGICVVMGLWIALGEVFNRPANLLLGSVTLEGLKEPIVCTVLWAVEASSALSRVGVPNLLLGGLQ